LLAKEQEVEEKTHHLKAATTEIENLKIEVSRLRRYEDELNNVQVSRLVEVSHLFKFIFNCYLLKWFNFFLYTYTGLF